MEYALEFTVINTKLFKVFWSDFAVIMAHSSWDWNQGVGLVTKSALKRTGWNTLYTFAVNNGGWHTSIGWGSPHLGKNHKGMFVWAAQLSHHVFYVFFDPTVSSQVDLSYPRSGCRGNSFSKEAQMLLFPATSTSFSGRFPKPSQASWDIESLQCVLSLPRWIFYKQSPPVRCLGGLVNHLSSLLSNWRSNGSTLRSILIAKLPISKVQPPNEENSYQLLVFMILSFQSLPKANDQRWELKYRWTQPPVLGLLLQLFFSTTGWASGVLQPLLIMSISRYLFFQSLANKIPVCVNSSMHAATLWPRKIVPDWEVLIFTSATSHSAVTYF